MRAASVVGRVGGLAVALGIGAALTTGTGVGLADTGDASASSASSDTGGSAASTGRPDNRPSTKTRAPKADGTSKRAGRASGAAATEHPRATSTPARDVAPADTGDTATPKTTNRSPRNRHTGTAAAPSRATARQQVAPRVRAGVDTDTATSAAAEVAKAPTPTAAIAAPPQAVATPAVTDVSVATAPVSTLVTVTTPEKRPVKRPAWATRLVSQVLAAAGLDPSANTDPLTPTESPALLALLAWSRREFGRSATPSAQVASVVAAAPASTAAPSTVTALAAAAAVPANPDAASPQPAKPAPGATTKLNWVTGSGITTAPYGTPGNYGVAGTDLGIMWDDGLGHILMLFGDTFDQPNMKGVWRSNVLMRSVDHNLTDKTLSIKDVVISPGGNYNANDWSNSFGATQVIRDPGFLGLFGRTTTIIPTAAISVTDADGNVTQYANVMSVRTWQTPGSWTTNWSGIAYSTDGGLTWKVDRNTIRSAGFLQASVPFRSGNQNFQQGAFVLGQPDDVDARGVQYVYSYGTPSGRNGYAYLSRVPVDQILDLGSYQYWAGDSKGWLTDKPSAAVAVIGGREQATGPFAWIQNLFGGVKSTVSELSIQYNEYLGQYVALYTDRNNNVVMRVSDTPQGLWSDAATLVANNLTTNSGMYAPMIHPWSGTDQLGEDNEQYLYWNLSWWGDYNVRLMQTDLSPMLTTV